MGVGATPNSGQSHAELLLLNDISEEPISKQGLLTLGNKNLNLPFRESKFNPYVRPQGSLQGATSHPTHGTSRSDGIRDTAGNVVSTTWEHELALSGKK